MRRKKDHFINITLFCLGMITLFVLAIIHIFIDTSSYKYPEYPINLKTTSLFFANDFQNDRNYSTYSFIKSQFSPRRHKNCPRVCFDDLINLQLYQNLQPVGSGGYGAVVRAIDTKTSREVIIKAVPLRKIEDHRWVYHGDDKTKPIPYEVSVNFYLKTVDEFSSNLSYILDYLTYNENYYMVFPWIDGFYNLKTVLKNYHPLPITIIDKIIINLVTGLEYLHRCGVAHGDIKDENIIIKSWEGPNENEFMLKIIDMGSAEYIDDTNMITNDYRGGARYKSPQVASKLPYNILKQDMWSLGVLIYYICFGTYPLEKNYDPNNFVINYNESRLNELHPIYKNILENLLSHDELMRYSSKELKSVVKTIMER